MTLIIFFAVLGLGFFSYTSLLPREGLPEFAYPLVFVQAQYQIGDANSVNEQLTLPIEKALKEVDGVKQVDTITSPVFSSAIINFESEYNSEEAADAVQVALDESTDLPSGAMVQVLPFKPTYDGKHDFLMALTGDESIQELQDRSNLLAVELEKLDGVEEANSIDLINSVYNPQTGGTVEIQNTFNRVGQKEGEGIVFSDSILIGIVKKDGVSDKDLSVEVRDMVEDMQEEGKMLDRVDVVYGADMAVDVDNQIASLESNALSALVAVVLILLLFVNWRSSIVTAIFIPTVMAATFLGLLLIGYSLNIIVLFGLILVLGLFVDDAIVVVETIDFHKRNGMKGLDAVREGINAIGAADVMGTLTTVIAFFPMVLISGILGEFIVPIPITVILSLLVSLVIALTVIPFFGYLIIPNGKKSKPREKFAIADVVLNGFNRQVISAGEKVSEFVGWYTQKKTRLLIVVVVSLLLIAGGGYFATQLKFAIFPPQKDSDGMSITINYPTGLTLETKQEVAEEVEDIVVGGYGEVVEGYNYLFVGVNQSGQDQAVIDIPLSDDRSETSVEIAAYVNQKVSEIEEARVVASEYQIGAPTEEYSYKMQIYSEDSDSLEAASSAIATFIKEDVELDGDVEVLDAHVEYIDSIAKRDGDRYVEVAAKISDPTNSGALNSIDEDIKEKFDNERLREYGLREEDLAYDKGFESENMKAFESAGIALIVAMLLIYLLLVVQFDSFMLPLLVFSAFPFSFPGLFPGLYLTDNAISFFVMVGIIALVGIVVNNTIMLLDFTAQSKQKGNNIRDAIVEAIRIRFRPLVATSVTTVVGLLPLALTDPLWESIALTIVFGLISSTLMVIFVFPAYYVIVEKVRDGAKGMVAKLLK